MLDIRMLNDMPDNCIFATGLTTDTPEGINLDNTGRKLRWLAKKGGGNDWKIYVAVDGFPIHIIVQHGMKVTDENTIKKLVPCDEEVYKLYRR